MIRSPADRPVLLWGSSTDGPLVEAHAGLQRAGIPCAFVDSQRADALEIVVEEDGVNGWLGVDDVRHDLADVRSVYARPAGTSADSSTAHARAVDAIFASWLEGTSALVVNPQSSMASNGSKPYQAGLILRAGLAVPATLLTTDIDAVHAFVARHERVVYKSISGVRSIVSRFTPRHLDRLHRLSTCPTQFQQYIDGPDYRVHVIGDALHGCVIESDVDDYRYPGDRAVTMRPWAVPDELASPLRSLSATLGLSMAGIDLRRDVDGTWVCFEVNPSPAFTVFDGEPGRPLLAAVMQLLSGDARGA